MKKSQLRQIIKEEISKVLSEITYIGSDGELKGDFTLNQLQLTPEVKNYIESKIK
jgi:hypothetical protein